MDKKDNLLSGLFSTSADFFDLQARSLKLGFYQKSTQALTTTIQLLIVALLAVVTYLFLNIGLAFLLGNLVGSLMGGFFIMCGVNLVLLIVYSLTKNQLGEKKIQNTILHSI